MAGRERRELPSGVVTFLLTDIEGSTRLWDEHPEEMARALPRHDELIAQRVTAQRGVTLKARGEGDATLSVFHRASDAAVAALELAQALRVEPWPEGIALQVRLALHTGEAFERDGDYYGPTLNRAARLRSLAAGGQLLVSEATVALLRDQLSAEAQIVDLGRHFLRGLTRDEHIYELTWPAAKTRLAVGTQPAEDRRVVLPIPRALEADEVFAGRNAELGQLDLAMRDVRSETRRVVLVAGEPGIGKTRLAAQFATRASGAGALVLYGRCDEDALVPYQPFVEALVPYVKACPPALLRAQLGGLTSELGLLVPQLSGKVPSVLTPVPAEPDTERYRLFEAVTTLVTAVANAQPVVLILDDLHWADKPTLLLLRHLLRSTERSPLFVLGTYRDVDVTPAHPLADVLADLRREQFVERLALGGLSQDELTVLLEALAGHPVEPGFTAALSDRTEGNPFFVREILRHLGETGAFEQREGRWVTTGGLEQLELPEGVREVVGRRLVRLSEAAHRVLVVASVMGRQFNLDALERSVDLPEDEILGALEEATAARLVEELADGFGTYAFAHLLIRETLYRDLTSARRGRLHARVGEALDALHGENPDRLAELAHHYYEGAAAGEVDKAIDCCRRAGDRSLALLAYEEAAQHYERALEALDLDPSADPARRCGLLIALGDARGRSGDRTGRIAAALEAAKAARRAGSAEHLAQAAILSSGWGVYVGTPEPEVIDLCEEALDAIGDDDTAMRVELLTRLADHRANSEGRPEVALPVAEEALRLAREVGDPEPLSIALYYAAATLQWSPRAELRVDYVNELLAYPGSHDDPRRRADALALRVRAHLERADLTAMRADLAELESLAFEHHVWLAGTVLVMYRTVVAFMEGRFDEAESFATDMATRAGSDPNFFNIYAGQLFWLHREQGRLEAFLPLLADATTYNPGLPAFRASLAVGQAELGLVQEAREHLELLAADGFAHIPRDVTWTASLFLLTEVCTRLGDGERAARIYELFRPHTGQLVAATATVACAGAVDRYLGMLLATTDRSDEAQSHYEAAVALETSIQAAPLLARTNLWYAHLLLRRDRKGDRSRARALLEDARCTASALGMSALADEATALIAG
jgi:class 3 adenylate cyclase/tetratricopeptide (TPR) repeat protein